MSTSPRCSRPTSRRSASTTWAMRRAVLRRCCRPIWRRRAGSARWRLAIPASRPAASPMPCGRTCRRTCTWRGFRSGRSAACASVTRSPSTASTSSRSASIAPISAPSAASKIRTSSSSRSTRSRFSARRSAATRTWLRCRPIRPTRPTRSKRRASACAAPSRRGSARLRRRFSTPRRRSSKPPACSASFATSRTPSMPKARRTCSRSPSRDPSARGRWARRRARVCSSADRRRLRAPAGQERVAARRRTPAPAAFSPRLPNAPTVVRLLTSRSPTC